MVLMKCPHVRFDTYNYNPIHECREKFTFILFTAFNIEQPSLVEGVLAHSYGVELDDL